jgi:hypothetical protein
MNMEVKWSPENQYGGEETIKKKEYGKKALLTTNVQEYP